MSTKNQTPCCPTPLTGHNAGKGGARNPVDYTPSPPAPMTNLQRAANAEKTLHFFASCCEEDETGLYDTMQQVMIDLLTDLQHMAFAARLNFPELLEKSEGQFVEEQMDENPVLAFLDNSLFSRRNP